MGCFSNVGEEVKWRVLWVVEGVMHEWEVGGEGDTARDKETKSTK